MAEAGIDCLFLVHEENGVVTAAARELLTPRAAPTLLIV